MADPKKPAAKPGVPTTDTPGFAFPDATPRERIAAALAGKPPRSLVEVRAADVVAIAGEVPAAKLTPLVADLRDGAVRSHRESRTPDEQTVYQVAGQLAQLLEVGREPVPEGP